MFYTLKHTNIGDESYSFETTAPPFSKKREGRLAKVACTNCRISKVRFLPLSFFLSFFLSRTGMFVN